MRLNGEASGGMDNRIQVALDTLTEESRELYLPAWITELYSMPDGIQFLRDYVCRGLPLIIRGITAEMGCVQKWSSKFFRETLAPDKEVKVAVTPNGLADGIGERRGRQYFVMPEERTVPLHHFLDNLEHRSRFVYSVQGQNNNLIDDFPELLPDVDKSFLAFTNEAFGKKKPVAVNFSMGDDRAITSLHKDPYENLFCIASGYRDFILIPPTDCHNVPREHFQSAVYKTNDDGEMEIEPLYDDTDKPIFIEWTAIDPLNPDLESYPRYPETKRYEVRLNAGDVLYLPSLWYYHVRQSHKNISINYWYDTEFDERYCYYKMVEKLCGFGF